MSLNEDSLLKPFRLRAGMPAPGPEMGGWYDELALDKTPSGGHGFCPAHSFGQWVSALSRGYAADHDPRKLAKINQLLDLYGASISPRFYTNFRFPAYVYEKLLIGLIDAHTFAGSTQAFPLLDRTTAAALPHLPPKALDRDEVQRAWRASVGDKTTNDYCWDEPYTLPENLYLAAQRGAGQQYRDLAPRYLLDQTFFDPLSEGRNVLPNHHAYSFCNSLNSAMQAYMVGGSEKHLRAASNAFDMITETQSYATGGWGPNESFVVPNTGALYASLKSTHSSFETPCGSYGHAKLTRYLLRVTRDGRYGDSMERILYNTVLGAKPLQADGTAFYYSDYNSAGKKSYFPDKWPCCSGTLPQIAADYRILTYFHDSDGVYVNLYLPSTLHWTTAEGAQLSLTQSSNYPLEGKITMRVKASRASRFALRLRIPAWSTASGETATLRVNGAPAPLVITAGFATLRRQWKDGDRIELELPLPMRLEPVDAQHPDTVALVRGPLVLFAIGEGTPNVTRAQLLAATRNSASREFTAQSASGPLRLLPFTAIADEHYSTYLTVG
ncbi:MAG TPA: beta-L-arabinofuranosidase domain-containing protein, partial [Acidisarcina sp.]